MTATNATPLLRLDDLARWFEVSPPFLERLIERRPRRWLKAVDGVSFEIRRGETFSLVGESGCGKSTVARVVVGLYKPTRGSVAFDGVNIADPASREDKIRRRMQMIFQEPCASLNQRMRVRGIIAEPIRAHGLAASRAATRERVDELLMQVKLTPADGEQYPHEFSGGQRQRISIARALASNPQFLVCDEPTSALDVSVQAQILNLLQDLQDKLGLTYLFVAHDLSVVKLVSDRVAVMYVGRIVELAPTEALFATPRHPYTEALLAAVPKPDPRLRARRILLEGEVADPSNPPPGCHFHPRCAYAVERCRVETPVLTEIVPGHAVACHRAPELTLRGVET